MRWTMPNSEAPDPGSAARAARMREQIKELESGSSETGASSAGQDGRAQLSARDLVRQRMRDLDRKK